MRQFTYSLAEHPIVNLNAWNEMGMTLGQQLYVVQFESKLAIQALHSVKSGDPPQPHRPHSIIADADPYPVPQSGYTEDREADILRLIGQRLSAGYSLDLEHNKRLSEQFADKSLAELWHFLALAHSRVRAEKRGEGRNPLRGLLHLATLAKREPTIVEKSGPIPAYTSETRKYMLECCGWARALEKPNELTVRG
jgi:hypothetical protein